MEIEQFLKIKKACKGTTQKIAENITAKKIAMLDATFLERKNTCKCCNHTKTQRITIKFKQEHKLTIFEANMLTKIYLDKQTPHDYANFHKTEYGKQFIENIQQIKIQEN